MNKRSILFIVIVLLLSVGVYVAVEQQKTVEVEIPQYPIEVEKDEVVEENIELEENIQNEVLSKESNEVIIPKYYNIDEALARIKKIDDLADQYYKKGVNKTLIIDGNTYYLKDLSKRLPYEEIPRTSFEDVDIDDHGTDRAKWYYYLSRPHPSVATLRSYFQIASKEFGIPIPILHAIAMREANWTMLSPSIDQGWGFMHLTDSGYSSTLIEASELLDLPPEVLKKDALQNIRGAAALLAKYNNYEHLKFSKYSDWKESLKKISGLDINELQESQIKNYYEIIYNGETSKTLWNETIKLEPNEDIY